MYKEMFGFRLPCYAPDDVGAVGTDKGFGVEEDLAILKDDTNDEEQDSETDDQSDESTDEDSQGDEDSTEQDEDNQEDDAEEDKDKKDKEEEDEETEEDTDEVKVTVKGIKKDFPDFFKKHPEMKGVIFREKQYSEIYNNPQEAQQAAKSANQFHAMEADLLNGDTEPLFKALKQTKGYEGFVSNLLPNLLKVDKEAYFEAIEVPLRQMLRRAFKEGTNKNNKNLVNSAAWLHQYLFDNTNFEEKAKFEKAAKPQEKPAAQVEYEKKIQQLEQRDYTNYKVSVDEEWAKGVEKAFLDGLDPDNVLSEKTKTWMLRDLMEELNEQMVKDTRYMRNIQGIWQQARSSGYNPSFKTRIVSTSLARAKQIIPTIRQKLRAEALNERRRVAKSKENGNTRVVPRVTSGGNNNTRKQPSKADMRGKSDLDIIRGL